MIFFLRYLFIDHVSDCCFGQTESPSLGKRANTLLRKLDRIDRPPNNGDFMFFLRHFFISYFFLDAPDRPKLPCFGKGASTLDGLNILKI